MARFPELLTPVIRKIIIVPNGNGQNRGGAILEDPEYPGIAVRTGCNQKPASCPERSGGSVCWDRVFVRDTFGNPTVYNSRTVFCRSSEDGRELIRAFKRQVAEEKTPKLPI